MFEVLKSIQARLDTIDKRLKDLAHGQIRLREDLNIFSSRYHTFGGTGRRLGGLIHGFKLRN